MSSEKPLPPESNEAHRQADFYDLLAWVEINKKKVLTAAIVLVAVGFIVATVRYMREQKEAKASASLLSLRAALNPSTNTVPPQASQFIKVAQEFGGTSAAERARILAATSYFSEGKYSDAEREFNAFLKDFPESPWAATAAYGAATAQEAQNKPDALAAYQKVSTAYPSSTVADDAKLAAARIYESRKQFDQALRIYNELLAPRPGGQPGEPGHPGAQPYKDALLRSHPELGTNAPALPPPTALTAPGSAPTLQLPATNSTAPQSSTNSGPKK